MKQNDIFEREFEGNSLRFQLTELNPCTVTIKVLDVTPQFCRSGKMLLAALPKCALAVKEDGVFVTTPIGDERIKRYSFDIYNRIKARRNSLLWINSNSEKTKEEAESLVDKTDQLLNYWEVRYLPEVVRWACNGEFDYEDGADIRRMKELFLSYHAHLTERTRGENANVRYKVKYDNSGFKRINDDGSEISLRSFDEVRDALRPWSNAETLFEKYAKEGENMDVMKALRLLTKAYMNECGFSLGLRTLFYTAGEMWQGDKLKAGCDNSLTEEQVNGPLVELMPLICEEYDPDYYGKWDIGWGISDEDFKKMCLDVVEENEYDEATLRALCWGIKQQPYLCEKWFDEDWKRFLEEESKNSDFLSIK